MPAPGVVVTTAVRSGPVGTSRAPSGQYFVLGITERGPVDAPQRINSMGDYKRIFGDRVTYGTLFDDLTAFFEAGGSQAQVLRVAGATASLGTLTLNDSAAVPSLRFDAANPGAWSSRLSVDIDPGGAGAASRKVSILLDGVVVESYDNLTSAAEFVSRFAASPYVRVTDLGSTTAAGSTAANLPSAGAATALTAGNDQRATVDTARLTTQLGLFKLGLGDGAIAAPTFGAAMHGALIAHAKENRRIAILSAAATATVNDLVAAATALANTAGNEYAGLFGPHIVVSDGAGGTRTIGPEGFVAAARSKAHAAIGPWAPAAGESSISPYVLGVAREFTRADHEKLDAARVSPIRLVAGRLRLYGWRSLSGNAELAQLTAGDTLNRLVTECEARLEPSVFRVIDGRGHLLAELKGVLIGVLEPIRAAGGLFERTDPINGDLLDPGYSVDVGPNLNTVASLAANEVRAVVGARLSPNASLISVTVVKVGLTAAV